MQIHGSKPLTPDQWALVEEHAAWARGIARRVYLGPDMTRDVVILVYDATLDGLADAARRYDPSKGKFTTWAVPRIKGAIQDELRALMPSRTYHTAWRALVKAEQAFRTRERRAGTDDEVAEEMGVPVKRVRKIRAEHATMSRFMNPGSFDDQWGSRDRLGDENFTLAEVLVDPNAVDPYEEVIERVGATDMVSGAVDRLPPRERSVVRMYFWQGQNLREIGEVMGVSESRVSQLRSKALSRLRLALQEVPLAA